MRPRPAVAISSVPVHASSSRTSRNRRERNHADRGRCGRGMASAAQMRGSRSIRSATSSWCTKNSFRFASWRSHPMRKKPGGGPARTVETRPVNEELVRVCRRRSAARPPRTGDDESRCGDQIVFTQDEVSDEVSSGPGFQQRRSLRPEVVEEIAQLLAVDRVEQDVHSRKVVSRRSGPAAARGWRPPPRAGSSNRSSPRSDRVPRARRRRTRASTTRRRAASSP